MRLLVIALATAGGVGYAPVASGTFGTLAAIPLVVALASLRERSVLWHAVAVVAVVVLAVWSAGRAEEVFGGHDHSHIVIDEVAGLVMAGLFVPATVAGLALAFVLFRLFDIWKPWPARVFDRDVAGGLGVVGDDLVAGVYAGLLGRVVLAAV